MANEVAVVADTLNPDVPQVAAHTKHEENLVIRSLVQATPALGQLLGLNCEVVVHDLRKPESSIVAIENGQVSGRSLGGPLIGGPINDIALKWLTANVAPGASKALSYDTVTSSGRKLKSATTLYYNSRRKAYAAFCLNFDMSDAFAASRWVAALLQPGDNERNSAQPGSGTPDFKEVLDQLIAEARAPFPLPPSSYSRDVRFQIVKNLEERGAFLMRGAVVKVASALSVSRFTIYGYLDEIRNGQ